MREGEDVGDVGGREVDGGDGGGGGEGGGVDAFGDVDVAGVAAAVGVAVAAAGVDGFDVEEGGKKRKRTVLRLKIRSPTKTKAAEGAKEDKDLKALVDAQSSPEPAKKRQKTLDNTTTDADNTTSLGINAAAAQSSTEPTAEKRQESLGTAEYDTAASLKANAAAARAVVFGLRARK